MSTNPFVQLQKLLPPSPLLVGKVTAHNVAADTSTIDLATGVAITTYAGALQTGTSMQARRRIVAIGKNAFIRDGVVESEAPDTMAVELEIGRVV